MYFVVYFIELNKNVILPTSWIRGIDDHFEKFMNKSLNTTQKFLCFYTNDETAFEDNGAPNIDYPADFSMALRNDFNGPGSFFGKLKHFKGKFNSKNPKTSISIAHFDFMF